jgi:phosphoenolpyruvate phosphomutase
MTILHAPLPEIRRAGLRRLLEIGAPVRAIEVHNGLSALIGSGAQAPTPSGEMRGFDALWLSSLTGSASRGLPDMEMYVLERRLELIEEVGHASTKPLIVDGDTGGDPATFEHLCGRLERIGVSAVVIEDKQHPKRNSLCLDSTHALEEPRAFAMKIARGKAALQTRDFMIFARLESLIAGGTVAEALDRAQIYLGAGAAGVMIHSKAREPDEIFEFLARFRAGGRDEPVICVPTTYNSVTARELFEHGATVVIHANHLLRAAHFAMQQAARTILEADRSLELDNSCTPVADLFRFVGYEAALKRERAAVEASR